MSGARPGEDWSAGYVTDVAYMPGFYHHQTPGFMALACLLNGFEPPGLDGLTYCDLGCGPGFGITLMGATDPGGTYVGVDFNPAHVAQGRRLITRAGLTNVRLIEASFADLTGPEAARHSLPSFDVITLHGVYSWVDEGLKRAIVRFIDRHLNPGGMVYLSYNCYPGWTTAMPVQRLLREVAARQPGESTGRFRTAHAVAQALHAAHAQGLGDKTVFEALDRELEGGNDAYLVHEYLNAHWRPLFFSDAVADMAAAKLVYAGAASLLDNFSQFQMTPEQRAVVDMLPDRVLRQQAGDFCAGRGFRRDVYLRGALRLDEPQQVDRLRRVRFINPRVEGGESLKVTTPVGTAELELRLYGPMLAWLREAPLTVGDLLARVAAEGVADRSPVEVAGMLAGSGLAVPVYDDPSPLVLDRVRRLNREIADLPLGQGRLKPSTALASALGRTGVFATLFDVLAYAALADGADETPEALADAAWARLSARGEALRHEGEPLEGEAANRAALIENFGPVLEGVVPMWRRLGVL
ncbi:class I SAM-dependent methyltransferase [Roseospira visakhapatnamensis]|uniref:SAM-dependent methyltransferase n=1 Tax=Roseospira visakhapatnamensis TaxID=390880 RepID=A0A7W6RA72_9PROT|nr:class I SAM-dependent methyltransferase [Roseospira visakhapatnamensis]MBB4264759.1 SAM-dependent methyltransferase [Roseospira visakhapatnamensis]